ncbi:DoxX family membrane protein [Pedobacter sp. AW31-3R]|uniref:DoxX family membrane protein n=1 Tax=Pedobacter sp. AW31-3R TaxID=3445781 RepID=UPI003FA0EB7E
MNLLTKIQNWGDRHHPQWLDYVRIALGLTLIINGVALASNLHYFTVLMHSAMLTTALSISLIAHLIIVVHIIGGILIALGTHTRESCVFNILAVIAAIIFVSMQTHIFAPYSLFWFCAAIFLALICFFVEGDGVLSIEHEDKAAE